jgi:hypothetical protein
MGLSSWPPKGTTPVAKNSRDNLDKLDVPQGTLDLMILTILAREPLHGYGISQRLAVPRTCVDGDRRRDCPWAGHRRLGIALRRDAAFRSRTWRPGHADRVGGHAGPHRGDCRMASGKPGIPPRSDRRRARQLRLSRGWRNSRIRQVNRRTGGRELFSVGFSLVGFSLVGSFNGLPSSCPPVDIPVSRPPPPPLLKSHARPTEPGRAKNS